MPPTTGTVRLHRVLRAPPERVYKAFLDPDAACDPEWPYNLALSLEDENVVATGGPNLPFPENFR